MKTLPPGGPTKPIAEIRISERIRRDMGDIAALARSIEEVGLLHPITVTPDGELLLGQRRLLACRELGWTEIEVKIREDGPRS